MEHGSAAWKFIEIIQEANLVKEQISQFFLRAIAIVFGSINRKASVFYSLRELGFHSENSCCLFYKIISLLMIASLSFHY